MVGYLMNFPLWKILFLLNIFGISIYVVHVELFLDMGAGINGGLWGHIFVWRYQHFFYYHSSSLV